MQHLIGKVVTFQEKIEEMETYAENGMRARIIQIETEDTSRPCLRDHIYKIKFDYSEFDEFNRRFESSNYYDDDGRPVLTAREAGFYKVQEVIYFGSPELWPFEQYFQLVNETQVKLIEQFNASEQTDYVAWLEQQVIDHIRHTP